MADKEVEECNVGELYHCETGAMRTAEKAAVATAEVEAEERELRIGKAQRGIR